jgi:hypothetical protein
MFTLRTQVCTKRRRKEISKQQKQEERCWRKRGHHQTLPADIKKYNEKVGL